MKPSSAFSNAAWQELYSLLAEAMPAANTSYLHDKEGAAVAAIEMRPRARSFESSLLPAAPMIAKWTVIILEADWTLHVAVLKMDRQVLEVKEFKLSQTLEVVEFLKSHPFLSSELIVCEGIKRSSSNLTPPSADFIYEKVSRSNNCELLLSASAPASSPHSSRVCRFCSDDTGDVKPPPEPKAESGYIANEQEMCSVKLEIEDDDGAYSDGVGENDDEDADDDHDWADDADDGDLFDYEDVSRKSASMLVETKSGTIFRCDVCGKKFARKGNYTRHMYLHKGRSKDKKSEDAGQDCGLEVKVENHFGSADDDDHESVESNGKEVTVKTGHSAGGVKKKRGPYKSRQDPPPGFKRPDINLDDVLAKPNAVKVERKSFKCDACSAIFVSEGRWALHMQKHRGEPDVDIPDIDEVKKRLKQAEKDRIAKGFICHLCGAVMGRASKYYHLRTFHQMEPEKHPCDKCGRVFTAKITLRQHMITHTEDKPFTCEFCGKSFRSRDSYLVCKRRCTGEGMFKCPHCAKPFARKEHLKNHIRTHTGERPYKCPLCNLGYAKRSNLCDHVGRAHKMKLSEARAEVAALMKADRDRGEAADIPSTPD